MDRHFDLDILELKGKIFAMGGFVEQAIHEATLALTNRELQRLDRVQDYEVQINKSHVSIDEYCLSFLARKSPLASDLRLILAIIKINTDLERMGDQAINITHNARHYLSQAPLNINIDLTQMTTEVRLMVRDSLDAFMKQDVSLANKVLDHDDVVDDLKHKIFRELLQHMTKDTTIIERALDLILIARNLERLADHATNIAEDVIFIATGEDVRHGGFKAKGATS